LKGFGGTFYKKSPQGKACKSEDRPGKRESVPNSPTAQPPSRPAAQPPSRPATAVSKDKPGNTRSAKAGPGRKKPEKLEESRKGF
jgi:hypothetical protein